MLGLQKIMPCPSNVVVTEDIDVEAAQLNKIKALPATGAEAS